MSCDSYRDILTMTYYQVPSFRDYVDRWCKLTGKRRHHAFENADVQRKCIQIVKEEKL